MFRLAAANEGELDVAGGQVARILELHGTDLGEIDLLATFVPLGHKADSALARDHDLGRVDRELSVSPFGSEAIARCSRGRRVRRDLIAFDAWLRDRGPIRSLEQRDV